VFLCICGLGGGSAETIHNECTLAESPWGGGKHSNNRQRTKWELDSRGGSQNAPSQKGPWPQHHEPAAGPGAPGGGGGDRGRDRGTPVPWCRIHNSAGVRWEGKRGAARGQVCDSGCLPWESCEAPPHTVGRGSEAAVPWVRVDRQRSRPRGPGCRTSATRRSSRPSGGTRRRRGPAAAPPPNPALGRRPGPGAAAPPTGGAAVCCAPWTGSGLKVGRPWTPC